MTPLPPRYDDPRERDSMTPDGRQRAPRILGAILDAAADRASAAGAPDAEGLRRIADRLAPPAPAPLPPDGAAALTRALADANHFLIDALPLNREGRLSDEQRRARARSLRAQRPTTIVIALGLTAAAAFLLVTSAPEELRALVAWHDVFSAARHLGYLLAYVGLSAAALFALAMATGRDGSSRELREGRVLVTEGIVTKRPTPASQTGWYLVGGRSYKVRAAAYRALVPGLCYRCYYLPRTGTLVNIEAIAGGARTVTE